MIRWPCGAPQEGIAGDPHFLLCEVCRYMQTEYMFFPQRFVLGALIDPLL